MKEYITKLSPQNQTILKKVLTETLAAIKNYLKLEEATGRIYNIADFTIDYIYWELPDIFNYTKAVARCTLKLDLKNWTAETKDLNNLKQFIWQETACDLVNVQLITEQKECSILAHMSFTLDMTE